MDWLKDAIVAYLKNNPQLKPDSIDIIGYFKLSADVTYNALKELENENRIVRHNGLLGGWNGNHYYTIAGE